MNNFMNLRNWSPPWSKHALPCSTELSQDLELCKFESPFQWSVACRLKQEQTWVDTYKYLSFNTKFGLDPEIEQWHVWICLRCTNKTKTNVLEAKARRFATRNNYGKWTLFWFHFQIKETAHFRLIYPKKQLQNLIFLPLTLIIITISYSSMQLIYQLFAFLLTDEAHDGDKPIDHEHPEFHECLVTHLVTCCSDSYPVYIQDRAIIQSKLL